jgi:RNA polymerase sigma-70 factor (ECF subfamily)
MAAIPIPTSAQCLHSAKVVRSNHPPSPSIDDLYTSYRDFIYRVALRVTHNAYDAEDIVQNVFLRMLRNRTGPEEGRSAGGYFRRSATNASIDLIRTRTQRAESELEPRYLAPEQTVLGQRYVKQVLDQLPHENSELFQLYYQDGYEYGELACRLDMRVGTVKSRLHRIRAALQEAIQARG